MATNKSSVSKIFLMVFKLRASNSITSYIDRSVDPSLRLSPLAFLTFTDSFCIIAPAQTLWLTFFITAPAPVGRPCPPFRNDIVTLRHMFYYKPKVKDIIFSRLIASFCLRPLPLQYAFDEGGFWTVLEITEPARSRAGSDSRNLSPPAPQNKFNIFSHSIVD